MLLAALMQPVGRKMVGYSWLDVTSISHTHRLLQSSTVLCVGIHITRTLINPLSSLSWLMFSSHISTHPLISFHSFSNHHPPSCFYLLYTTTTIILQAYQWPFFFSPSSILLVLQSVLAILDSSWILHSLLPL